MGLGIVVLSVLLSGVVVFSLIFPRMVWRGTAFDHDPSCRRLSARYFSMSSVMIGFVVLAL